VDASKVDGGWAAAGGVLSRCRPAPAGPGWAAGHVLPGRRLAGRRGPRRAGRSGAAAPRPRAGRAVCRLRRGPTAPRVSAEAQGRHTGCPVGCPTVSEERAARSADVPVAGRPAGTAAAGPFSAGARGAEPYGRPCGPDPAALRGGGAAPPAGAVAGGPPHHYVSTHVRFPSRSAPAPRVGALVGPGPPGGAGRTGVRGPKALRGGDHAARAAGGRPGRGGADRQRERALPQPV